jgi:hypothetical protein
MGLLAEEPALPFALIGIVLVLLSPQAVVPIICLLALWIVLSTLKTSFGL